MFYIYSVKLNENNFTFRFPSVLNMGQSYMLSCKNILEFKTNNCNTDYMDPASTDFLKIQYSFYLLCSYEKPS